MTLGVGAKLGPYEILGPIGAGGMGEVYRARDTKLKRDVAVKVLPDIFAKDAARRARFMHEAELLAALNHPNIAIIYGLEDSTARVALAMELVAGAPLGEKIRPHGMPLEDALGLAIQIASGLEAAHRAGIVHRDLKPSNIMVSPAGAVKLLDFGLAKLLEPEKAPDDVTRTIGSAPQTEDGHILGTVAYMSPEQAQAKPVDARSDIFSFGIVLFEMLTGRKPFEAENRISTLAAILREDPKHPSELSSEPLPHEAERIVMRCLRKDPERRYQTAADLRLALEDLEEDSASGHLAAPPPAVRRRKPWIWAAGALVLAAAAAGVSLWISSRPRPTAYTLQQVTFEVGIAQNPALSPDGKLLAYASDRSGEGPMDIWLKQVAGGDPVRLTRGPGSKNFPQFSEDGTSIYYVNEGDLFEIPALGGSPRKVVEQVGPFFAISSRGDIVSYTERTADGPGPITIRPLRGGPPEPWHPECRAITLPAWSPEGDRLAFEGACEGDTKIDDTKIDKVNIFVAPRHGGAVKAIGTWEGRMQAARMVWFRSRRGSDSVVLPLRSGDSLNLVRIGLDGSRQALTQGAGTEVMPAISPLGELVFTRSDEIPAVWSKPLADPTQEPAREAAPAQGFATSPDGKKLVFGRMQGAVRGEMVMHDRQTGAETVLATHNLLSEGAGSLWPQISPDGARVVYRAYTDVFGAYIVSAEGGAPRLLAPIKSLNLATDWSPDGKRILGECGTHNGICQVDPASGAVTMLLKDSGGGLLLYPSYSWDGKWVTFMRRRSGSTVICAAPVHNDGTLAGESDWVRISPENDQATRPRFAPDGASLFYAVVRKPTMELMKQKLDPATKHPMGDPVKVAKAPFSGPGQFLITVTRDRLFYNTDEIRSNIWMTKLE